MGVFYDGSFIWLAGNPISRSHTSGTDCTVKIAINGTHVEGYEDGVLMTSGPMTALE